MKTPVTFLHVFCEGLKTPLAGFDFMNRNRKLWRYGILPVAVNLLLTGFMLLTLIAAGAYFVSAIHPKFPPGFFGWVFEILTVIFLVVLAVGLTFGFWLVMQIACCGYFYGRLAVQVERLLGMKREEIVELPLVQEIHDTLRESISLLIVNLLCLLVQIVPVAGAVVGISGSYLFTCLALGKEYWDYPLSLRGMRRNEKREFARRHFPQTLGLGTSVAILFMIPVVNAVLLTTAVTGAVLLHRKLIESQPSS
jgi:CysZ protein